MFTYIFNFVKQLFGYDTISEYEENDNVENFLAKELLNLELDDKNYDSLETEINVEVPQEHCFEQTGTIQI